MGDYYYSEDVARWSGTGVGTNAGVTVTIAGVAGQKPSVRGIQYSSDAAAVVTIESPAATILWRKRFAAAFQESEVFELGTIMAGSGAAILVKISASTSNCEANIQGISIQG
jgi:uncharacterized protein YhbP (UPF0306 family)